MAKSKIIDSIVADLAYRGNRLQVIQYARTAADRWMEQCRKQQRMTDAKRTRCLQDCAECIYCEEEN